jgi:hypothetical protein
VLQTLHVPPQRIAQPRKRAGAFAKRHRSTKAHSSAPSLTTVTAHTTPSDLPFRAHAVPLVFTPSHPLRAPPPLYATFSVAPARARTAAAPALR